MSSHRHESPRNDGASRMPADARRLMPGDRVAFDLFEGDDGPPYALNVTLIDVTDATPRTDES